MMTEGKQLNFFLEKGIRATVDGDNVRLSSSGNNGGLFDDSGRKLEIGNIVRSGSIGRGSSLYTRYGGATHSGEAAASQRVHIISSHEIKDTDVTSTSTTNIHVGANYDSRLMNAKSMYKWWNPATYDGTGHRFRVSNIGDIILWRHMSASALVRRFEGDIDSLATLRMILNEVVLPSSQIWIFAYDIDQKHFILHNDASNTILLSENGLDWDAKTLPLSEARTKALIGCGDHLFQYHTNSAISRDYAFSEDCGNTWTQGEFPIAMNNMQLMPQYHPVWFIRGSSASNIWHMFRSTDKGKTWSQDGMPDTFSGGQYWTIFGRPNIFREDWKENPKGTFFAVRNLAQNHGFRSEDFGLTWEMVNLPESRAYGVDTALGCSDGHTFLLTHTSLAFSIDEGKTWSLRSRPSTEEPICVDEGFFVCGDTFSIEPPGSVLRWRHSGLSGPFQRVNSSLYPGKIIGNLININLGNYISYE